MRRLATAALRSPPCSACGAARLRLAPARRRTRPSAPAKRGVGLKKIGDFDNPVYVAGAPGFPKLLFVVEQPGRVVGAARRPARCASPFLDIRGLVGYDGGERGLLSIAFPPDYAPERQLLRLLHRQRRQHPRRRIQAPQRRPARRAAPSASVIEIPHPVNANHNGGQLQFLGDLLYFGTGDGGSGGDPPNNAQNKDVLLGKLLRIDPRPSGRPALLGPGRSNPFVGKPGRDEIYSYGLRNPFRFSFDTVSAEQPRIAIGDVGQNRFEELDYTTVAAPSGANFGWDAFEGFAPYTEENSGTPDPGGTTKPIFAYSHSRGGSCSIIGGYVVRDRSPALSL